ncbi:uncharacterized protein EV422DRAFT_506564 [Fimicolochytrium jonesii]|uniref:uncharacterized protein n=1 Tax=Fimicolochytrium jonesii TaxID=1396493 RepID=UPI0022FDE3E4|nr:uncharacterized protein EV422DRAFT_506564 [Fimicolochytrium jonesii]KAI8820844.1 hypothetical protein EV422DRAFT_506564 [Fimicolochytrium jonesii]
MPQPALTTLNRNQFYLGYIVFPGESNEATPAESSFPTNLPCIQSPPSPAVQQTSSAGDPPYRRLRDAKHHPILVHRYDPEDEVATVFAASPHPVSAHRSVDDQGQSGVTIAPDEKKKLVRYHWQYWRNVGYDDDREEDSKDGEPDGGEAGAVAGGGVDADERGGGAGRGGCGNAGGSSSQSRKAWAERVQYALTHPDVPEEKDDSLKPFLNRIQT